MAALRVNFKRGVPIAQHQGEWFESSIPTFPPRTVRAARGLSTLAGMAGVYLETSFVSACVSARTDAASVYRREASLDWWRSQRSGHILFISDEVVAELSDPGHKNAASAVEFVKAVPRIDLSPDVVGFAGLLVEQRVMPAPVAGDAIHVAAAAVAGLEYLLSWNVRHLANPNKTEHLRVVCMRMGLMPPRIVTPDFLWQDT